MADRAAQCGLEFTADAFARHHARRDDPLRRGGKCVDPNPIGRIHRTPVLFQLFGGYERKPGQTDPAHEWAASSAVRRLDKDAGYSALSSSAKLIRLSKRWAAGPSMIGVTTSGVRSRGLLVVP